MENDCTLSVLKFGDDEGEEEEEEEEEGGVTYFVLRRQAGVLAFKCAYSRRGHGAPLRGVPVLWPPN